MRSTTSAFFKKIFRRARIRCAVPCVSGAASASAHGQATIRTEVKAFNALRRILKHPEHRRRQRDADDQLGETPAVAVRQRVEIVIAVFTKSLVVPERRQIALRDGLDRFDFDRAADLPAAGVKMGADGAVTGSDSPVTKL